MSKNNKNQKTEENADVLPTENVNSEVQNDSVLPSENSDVGSETPATETPAPVLDSTVQESEDEGSEEEEIGDDEEFELTLKLARPHPNHAFRIGSVVVAGYNPSKYKLNGKEVKELMQAGVSHWVHCAELEAEKAKK